MKFLKSQLLCGLLFHSLCGATLHATLSLPAIFGDHMVLQQGRALPVWGKATAGEQVTVSIAGQQKKVAADSEGSWKVMLDPLSASENPLALEVRTESQRLNFQDVLVGDVWVCAGQSNMGVGIGAVPDSGKIIAEANQPFIRLFTVERNVAFTEQDDCGGKWVVCTPESLMSVGGAKGFSAVGYLFGQEIQRSIQKPVGLIQSSVGGTRVECWTSRSALESDPLFQGSIQKLQTYRKDLPEMMKRYTEEEFPKWEKAYTAQQNAFKESMEKWKQSVSAGEAVPRPAPNITARKPQAPDKNFSVPTVLFNGMVNPLIPFGITGVIWYQGEADAYPKFDELYAKLFPVMIQDWRSRWGQGDFPFLYVQLPNYGDKPNWPVVRNSQLKALSTPNTGMAVTIDVGDSKDLHPSNKAPVAHRLALLAREKVYGEKIVGSGPIIESLTKEGNRVWLSFRSGGSGLVARPVSGEKSALSGFELAASDGIFHPAEAWIEGNRVGVKSERVGEPMQVRYAWAATPEPPVNFYNQEGLPASPFLLEVPK